MDPIVRGMARVAIINRLQDLLRQLSELDDCDHRLSCMACGIRLGSKLLDWEEKAEVDLSYDYES